MSRISNGAKAQINNLSASATSLTFTAPNAGDEFPTEVPFWGTIYNSGVYGNPADDPDAEIVRIEGTDYPNDQLTNIKRSQLSTSAIDRSTGNHGIVHGIYAHDNPGLLSVAAFGAKGDGVADDTASIQEAFDTAYLLNIPEVFFPTTKHKYLLGDEIIVKHKCKVWGLNRLGAVLHQITPGKKCFRVTRDDVIGNLGGQRFEKLGLRGPRFGSSATENLEEVGIFFDGDDRGTVGVDPIEYLDQAKVFDCDIEGWGGYGIRADFLENFQFVENRVANTWYGGIQGRSVLTGKIVENEIFDVLGNGESNYGISITSSVGEDGWYPQSQDVDVIENYVDGVLNWELFDTHGGIRIRFIGNTGKNGRIGINVTALTIHDPTITVPAHGNYNKYAPMGCVIIDNDLDSGLADGSGREGIIVSGAIGHADFGTGVAGAISEYAKAIKVIGNTTKGFGDKNAPAGGSGGFYFLITEGLLVEGNESENSSPYAYCFYHDNKDGLVVGNVGIDPWEESGHNPSVIEVRSTHNSLTLIGNKGLRSNMDSAGPPPRNIFEMGVAVFDHSTNEIDYGLNHFKAASNSALYDNGGRSSARQSATLRLDRGFSTGVTVTGVNLTLDPMLHHVVGVNTQSGAFTITLPLVTDFEEGDEFIIKDVQENASANNITVDPNGQNIDTNPGNRIINSDGGSLKLKAVGSHWHII